LIDDVAVDFPDMQIILAHPSWPWTDEALSMALHKPILKGNALRLLFGK